MTSENRPRGGDGDDQREPTPQRADPAAGLAMTRENRPRGGDGDDQGEPTPQADLAAVAIQLVSKRMGRQKSGPR